MRGCWLGLFLVAAVVVFLGAVAFAMLAQPAGMPPQSPPVPVSTAAAVRFDGKVATARRATEPATVEITEEEATSKLAESLASEPSAPKVDQPQVIFRAGKVYLSGVSRDTPIPITFVVTGRVEAVAGRPRVTVEQIEAGRLPVTGALQAQVDRLIADQDRWIGDLDVYVTEVRVFDGKLAVTGRPK